MSQRREQAAQKEKELLEQEQAYEEKQELLAEEQAANPSEPSPVSYFYNSDSDNISTPSTTYTIRLTKSATIINNLSEPTRCIYHNNDIFFDGDDDEELFPDEVKIIQHITEKTSFDAITPDFPITDSLSMRDEHLSTIPETKSDELIKSSVENLVPTPNSSIISSPKINSFLEEFFGELAHIDLIPPGINETNFDPEEDIHLMPPGIEKDDYDSERDILFLEELLSNDSPSLSENESFHFDVPSSPRPLTKPSDDGIYFTPDTRLLTAKVVGDISEHYVLMPRLLPTQPTLCPVIDTLLPFSSKNEDKVHLLSHWDFKAFHLFSESPMMIYGGNIPTLDVPFLHFYTP
nr:hypothetical protein [Tanacetum cinerariifolium]